MDCINFLPFIQVAVAFNLGLVYISEQHIMSKVNRHVRQEFSLRYGNIIETTRNLLGDYEYAREYSIRRGRAALQEKLNQLRQITNPDSAEWGKYALMGIASGIYGLLILLVLSFKGCQYDTQFQDFLLISGEFVLAYQILTLLQIFNIKGSTISYIKVIKKIGLLILFLIIAIGLILTGWYIPFWSNFNKPFVIGSIIIVYMPIVVYVIRIISALFKVERVANGCKRAKELFIAKVSSIQPNI